MGELSGWIVTPTGVLYGRLHVDGLIQAIEPVTEPTDNVADAEWILPGFIDLHVHGGGGADCMEGTEAIRQMARFHSRHGTTSLLATTMTDEPPRLVQVFEGIAAAMALPDGQMANVLGVHLEGPFISPDAMGAQPPYAIAPDPFLAANLHAIAPIKVVTMAPEIDEACLLLDFFKSVGTAVQIGHTCATQAQARVALEQGYSGFTHLFNAMTGLHHRQSGVVGCALAYGNHAELIMDLIHVEPTAVRLALRAIPNLYAITDAGAAAGMPDGTYKLGAHEVIKTGEKVLMPDGRTIAGSALTMDQAFRNCLALGLDVVDASRRCAGIQADYLKLTDRGEIAVGTRADLVMMDRDFAIRDVWVAGQSIFECS